MLALLCGCHDASENKPQTDQGSELIQALTTKPQGDIPSFRTEKLPKIDPASDRAKTAFGEALAKMAAGMDRYLKAQDQIIEVKWEYTSEDRSFGIFFDVAKKTLSYHDIGGSATASGVTPDMVKKASAEYGLRAAPETFKNFGCSVSYNDQPG